MKSSKHHIIKEEPYHHNPHYQIKFPGLEGYHFPAGKQDNLFVWQHSDFKIPLIRKIGMYKRK